MDNFLRVGANIENWFEPQILLEGLIHPLIGGCGFELSTVLETIYKNSSVK